MMNVQMVADYRDRKPDVIIKHLKFGTKLVLSDTTLLHSNKKFVNFERVFQS